MIYWSTCFRPNLRIVLALISHSSLIPNMFDCNNLPCARSFSEVVLYLLGLFLRLGNRDKVPGAKGKKIRSRRERVGVC